MLCHNYLLTYLYNRFFLLHFNPLVTNHNIKSTYLKLALRYTILRIWQGNFIEVGARATIFARTKGFLNKKRSAWMSILLLALCKLLFMKARRTHAPSLPSLYPSVLNNKANMQHQDSLPSKHVIHLLLT